MTPLAALIGAYHEADVPHGALRATLPLAGRTLVERQARIAAAAGANPIVILVERLPPDLLAAIDRLRAEGVSVAIARDAVEAAEAIHPETRLLLIADGLITDEANVERLVAAGAPALLTLPDEAGDHLFERIDAESLWAGLALLDGNMLRRTAAELGDWDLQSTLLRRAAAAGARQFGLRADAGERLTIARRAEDLQPVHSAIVENATSAHGGWISRYVLAPLEAAVTRLLMPQAVSPGWLYIGNAALVALGGLFFAKGWPGAGLGALVASTPIEGIARRLAALRMQRMEAPDWWGYASPLLHALALGALAYSLSYVRGWGCYALAGTAMAFLFALIVERGKREVPGEVWLAEPKAMIWLLLPFALIDEWGWGLLALALYAAGSFFWVQRQVHGPAASPSPD